MWSYDGWQAMCYATEEVKDPNRNLPIASLVGTAIVMVLYVSLNLSYFSAISLQQFHDLNEKKNNSTLISTFIFNSFAEQSSVQTTQMTQSIGVVSPTSLTPSNSTLPLADTALPEILYQGNEIPLQTGQLPGLLNYFLLLIMLGCLSANFNTTLSNAFTTARLAFVAARHGHLPKFIGVL